MMNYPFILHHSWLEYKHKNVVVPPVHGDNPTALARGLPYEQVARHGITIYIPHTSVQSLYFVLKLVRVVY